MYLLKYEQTHNMGMRQWLLLVLLEIPLGLIVHYIKERRCD